MTELLSIAKWLSIVLLAIIMCACEAGGVQIPDRDPHLIPLVQNYDPWTIQPGVPTDAYYVINQPHHDYQRIEIDPAGKYYCISTFTNPKGWKPIAVKIYDFQGHDILSIQADNIEFLGYDAVLLGSDLDAVVWKLDHGSAVRKISLREAFPMARKINDLIAISRRGDIAAVVDGTTLMIRSAEGELVAVPSIKDPDENHIVWSGDGEILLVADDTERTYIVDRGGAILSVLKRPILAWKRTAIAERSFVFSTRDSFYVASITRSFSCEKQASLTSGASACVQADPTGSLILLLGQNTGMVFRMKSNGQYERLRLPSRLVPGWMAITECDSR